MINSIVLSSKLACLHDDGPFVQKESIVKIINISQLLMLENRDRSLSKGVFKNKENKERSFYSGKDSIKHYHAEYTIVT